MFHEPFSVRRDKSKKRGEPTIYRYDELPDSFRVQVATILLQTLGSDKYSLRASQIYIAGIATDLWELIHESIAFHHGVFDLAPESRSWQDTVVSFLQVANSIEVLDAIEMVFAVVDAEWYRELSSTDRDLNVPYYMSSDDAIALLNQTFRRHDLGYYFTGGMIVRIDNTFMHAEVVEPALGLLHEVEFKGASDEFLSAHRHYRKGELKDAITDANNAFESTLKTICRKRCVSITGKEKTDQLVDTVVRALVPPHMQSYFDGLRSAMKGLPVLRNNTAGAAHGQGEMPQDVVDHAAAFALHLTAANIVFLIQAWQELERRDPRS